LVSGRFQINRLIVFGFQGSVGDAATLTVVPLALIQEIGGISIYLGLECQILIVILLKLK
jgi:hypothetical protein